MSKTSVFVLTTKGLDNAAIETLKKIHGEGVKIAIIEDAWAFSDKGLITASHRKENEGLVYIKSGEFSPLAVIQALEAGVPVRVIKQNVATFQFEVFKLKKDKDSQKIVATNALTGDKNEVLPTNAGTVAIINSNELVGAGV